MKKFAYLPLLFLVILSCGQVPPPALELEAYASGFSQPVDIKNAGDGRLFVVERAGIIRIVENGSVLSTPFLDIRSKVYDDQGEQGLLGLAFHPDYANNGYFYVHYINNSQNTFICRFTVSSDPNIANPATEILIFDADQPDWNHNGGSLLFGPDGYLYFGIGDGGGWRDTYKNGQKTSTILGGIGRIDVDSGIKYGIPDGNPFKGSSTDSEELFHYGLRNPWRFSFDAETGDLWIGDVGQDDWEEFNYLPAGEAGANFGWPCREGMHTPSWQDTCGASPEYMEPVYEFTHPQGANSAIGGYVYRGERWNRMKGYYVFTDLALGNMYTLYPNGSGGWNDIDHGSNADAAYVTFGEDHEGELYVAAYGSGTIYKVIDGGCKDYAPDLMATLGEDPTLQVDESVSREWFREGSEDVISTADVLNNIQIGGSYYAYAENADGCKWFTDSIQVNITGSEELQETDYKIFPNPSQNTFRMTAPERINFRLVDLNGLTLLEKKGVMTFDFGNELNPGQYMVEMETPIGTISRKIIKK